MQLSKLPIYYHTLVHLKPVQITARIRAKLPRPRPSTGLAPELRIPTDAWRRPPEREAVMTGPQTFRFLNETHVVDTASGWSFPSNQEVSLFNLHYFDDLASRGAEHRTAWQRAIMDRWITENAIGSQPGWDPYPTSLRIVNWIKWTLADNSLSKAMLHSLAVQARYLRTHLEWELLGNHLLANVKALVFAGMFFRGPEANEWLETGLSILDRQLPEQVLSDGGHFERSPMYQCIMVEDMLDMVNLTRTFPTALSDRGADVVNRWTHDAGRMRYWLKVMTHPDGGVSFFNDSALAIAPTSAELEQYANRLGLPAATEPSDGITHLPETGYIRLQHGPMAALLDVAPIGPDYLPGHAHADTLSFELSLYGQRVLVNSGTSTYAISAQRRWERSTSAHNTVVVDDQNSAEVWASFRVARRGYPVGLKVDEKPGGHMKVECGHTGYRRLPGSPIHRREWNFKPGTLDVVDRVEGPHKTAESWYHLHPNITHQTLSATEAELCHANHRIAFQAPASELRIAQSTFQPEFGISVPNTSISVPISGGAGQVEISWSANPTPHNGCDSV